MFTTKIRNDILTYVRSSLPIDTGNLRFNGTKEIGSRHRFSILVGGNEADYFEILEESVNSDYYGDFEHKTVPQVVKLLERMVNKKGYRKDFALLSREKELDSNVDAIEKDNFVSIQKTLLASLYRTGSLE